MRTAALLLLLLAASPPPASAQSASWVACAYAGVIHLNVTSPDCSPCNTLVLLPVSAWDRAAPGSPYCVPVLCIPQYVTSSSDYWAACEPAVYAYPPHRRTWSTSVAAFVIVGVIFFLLLACSGLFFYWS
jgi:hypothetical protein